MIVKNKEEFYRLYETGMLGNKPQNWSSVDDYLADSYEGTVSVRYRGTSGIGGRRKAPAKYNVFKKDVPAVVEEWVAEGLDRDLIQINESAPDDKLILQGEVYLSPRGLELRYSAFKGKMRDALKAHSIRLYGLAATLILRRHMSPSSWSDFQELLDLFPGDFNGGAVIEFGIYSINVGDCRGRNTLIWEVRDY